VAALDADLPVKARTTAMSQPHVIEYTLRFASDETALASAETPDAAAAAAAAAPAQGPDASPGAFRNADLGNGWEVQRSLPLSHATQFSVDYYEGGYKLICLSDGTRYLLVPEGRDVPAGLADDIVPLRQPIGDVYLAASDAMCLFDALDAVDAITVSGIAQDDWSVPSAVRAMEEGRIAYGGKYRTPDYDTLLARGCRLAIESTMINHVPAVRDKLNDLGIPVFTERSSYEGEPLGRAEWVKLYGALLDKEDAAQHIFDAQVKQVQAVEGADTGKTVAYFYINSNGAAVVRRPGDYLAKMIEAAGGHYAFDALGDDSATSTVTLEMERFYAQAKDADIIVYNATIDGGVHSLDDLVGKNPLLARFKAVQEGEVWITEHDMYQQMVNTGDIIADFNRAFSGAGGTTTYVRKLA
jgi:iron complex transport system substrate-binding protein